MSCWAVCLPTASTQAGEDLLRGQVVAVPVQVARIASTSTLRPGAARAARAAAAGQQADLRQRDPFGLPAATVALVPDHHPLDQDGGVGAGQSGQGVEMLAASGLRLCGMVMLPTVSDVVGSRSSPISGRCSS